MWGDEMGLSTRSLKVFIHAGINLQHLFRWEISTVRTALPGFPPSGWSFSSGSSTLSSLWCSAPGGISSDVWQTGKRERKHTETRIVETSAGLKQSHTHLFSSGRQARISSDPPLDVEVALTVATQVDGTRRDVDVHQVVDDSALDVVEDAVHQVATAHVHDLYVGQIPGEKTGKSSIYTAVDALWWKSCCLLTCPELHPAAGRKTRNTWSSP